MDIRDRVMGDQPNDFLHKIASIVPGYKGYVDRERRRDADRLLRTGLARRYQAQLTRLKRVQQALLRSNDLNTIGTLDTISGKLQRFIDRLQNATYGYAGLFAAIKVEGEELDQIYAFDMALTSGVDTLSSALDTLESATDGAEKAEVPAAIGRLESAVDELNDRFDQRADLLTTGTPLPQAQYQAMVGGFQQGGAGSTYGQQPGGETPSPYAQQASYPGSTGAPTTSTAGSYYGNEVGQGNPGEAPTTSTGAVGGYGAPATLGQAGIAGSGASVEDVQPATTSGPIAAAGAGQEHNMLPVDEPSIASGGSETARVSWGSSMQPDPAVDSMAQGNDSFAGTPTGTGQGGSSPMTLGGSAGTGIESASSPAAAPGAPGGDIVDGADYANNLGGLNDPGQLSGSDLSVDTGGTLGTGSTDISSLNPGTGMGRPGGSETQT